MLKIRFIYTMLTLFQTTYAFGKKIVYNLQLLLCSSLLFSFRHLVLTLYSLVMFFFFSFSFFLFFYISDVLKSLL